MTQPRWIWLDPARYPDFQTTRCTTFSSAEPHFCVAEFRRVFAPGRRVVRASVRVSGDTKFWLWINGQFTGMGPVCAGGDYGNTLPMPVYYANRYDVAPDSDIIEVFARVQLSPAVMTDYSCGRGGFFFECEAVFEDGSRETLVSDESWQARRNGQYLSATDTDLTVPPDEWTQARSVPPVWNLKDAPIPMLSERTVYPERREGFAVRPGETGEITLLFDRIYSGYCVFELKAAGPCRVTVSSFELEGQGGGTETLVASRSVSYRGLRMQSVGGVTLRLENEGDQPAELINPALVFCCYPADTQGRFDCSDPGLTRVWDVCKWTLQICRQSLHLDSPRHQETLGCTGDYYIESLMTWFAFGDARLTRLDVVRTADWLTLSGGFMFHTTYSMIWIDMLKDCYLYTGDRSLLDETARALRLLLDRFDAYVGDSGLIETPPSWMFVDWITVGRHSLHHPPKALGQTALCLFYYRGLLSAAYLFGEAGDEERAALCRLRAEKLRSAVNTLLFDEEKGLYVSGLNTPQQPCAVPVPQGVADSAPFMPENISERFYTTHANALAVYSGLCEGEQARKIMRRVMEGGSLVPYQPYFAHFVLDALWSCGLFGQYGMPLIERWKPMIDACGKGLQEGWISPGGSYSFDHSHAWGGTPAYQLPCRLLGFEILEPGFRKIALHPDLMGLDWADIEMPTPFGPMRCALRKDGFRMEKPDEITVELR